MRECGELVQVGDSEYSGLAQNTSRSLIMCDMCHMCYVSHVTRVMCVTPGLSRQGDNNMTKPLVGTDKEFNHLITIRNDLI